MADSSVSPTDKLKQIGVFGKKVDDSLIQLLKKAELKNSIKKAIDDVRQEEKKYIAKVKQWGTDIAEAIVKEVEEGKLAFVVRVLNAYQPELQGERDALVEAGRVLEKKAAATAALLILKDPKKGTAQVTATVPADKAAALSAVAWVQCLGCKGGGKPNAASGAGLENDKVEEAVGKATALAQEKLA